MQVEFATLPGELEPKHPFLGGEHEKNLVIYSPLGPRSSCLGCAWPSRPAFRRRTSDLSSELTGPSTAALGDSPLITVNYANAGPGTKQMRGSLTFMFRPDSR